MSELRPINLSAAAVEEILGGRQTFRVEKAGGEDSPCPYGKPGDRLWVREPFRRATRGEAGATGSGVQYGVQYRVDGTRCWRRKRTIVTGSTIEEKVSVGFLPEWQDAKWRPAAALPEWASRFTLEVTATKKARRHGGQTVWTVDLELMEGEP